MWRNGGGLLLKLWRFLKNWIAVLGAALALGFTLLHLVLNAFGLELRNWASYLAFFLTVGALIWGAFQLIRKIRSRGWRTALTWLLAAALLATSPFAVFLMGFSYLPEYVVTKNDTKLVAYVDGFMHTNVKYYDYKGFIVRGTKLRLYEDYGSGGFDPIGNSYGLTYEVQSSVWYDE